MLLLKSMDRLRSRISVFLAVQLFIPIFFILHNLNNSFADTTRDDQFPDTSELSQDDTTQNTDAVYKETEEKLKNVYGPSSPTGSEEQIAISAPKKIAKVTPPPQPAPPPAPAPAPAPVENTASQSLEQEAKKVPDQQVDEEDAAKKLEEEQVKELQAKLVKEKEKLNKEEKKSEAPSIPAPAKTNQETPLRIDTKDDSKEQLKSLKKEKKHYGMTLDELSQQWNALSDKSSASDSKIVYKKLSKQDKKLVNIKVKAERDLAKKRMPALDRGYFNEAITKETVIAQKNFVIGKVKTLNETVQRAKDVSLQIKLTDQKEKAARARVYKAFRDLISEVRFEFIYKNGELSPSQQTGAAFKSNMQRLDFKQPIFHGGNLWNLYRQEAASLKASREDVEKTSAKLTLDVAAAYLNYSRAQTLYQAKFALATQAETLRVQNEEKKKVGAVSEIEYLNADSLVGEIKADLETAHQELALAHIDLQKFVKIPREETFAVESIDTLKDKIIASNAGVQVTTVPTLEDPTAMNAELDTLINLAYQKRADLRVEEFKFMSNRYKTKAAYGKFLPQADFIAEFGELAEAFTQIDKTPPYHTEFKFGVEVSQNLLGSTGRYSFDTTQTAPSVTAFQGGNGTRIKQNKFTFALFDALQQFVDVREARAQMLEQMVELQEKENEVVKEVKENYYGYHKALIHLDSAIKKMLHKERVAKLKSYQLEKNQIQLSEYLQAEKDFIDAKTQYTEAVSDYYKMRISLNRAIGEKDLLQVEGNPFSRKEKAIA